MEHRNSTSVTSGNSMGTDGTGPLGTVAHEFFHTWNVKRIRPRTLEPFDYDRANMSDALWIAEGFTQYYGQLLMLRSGYAGAAIARIVSGTINAVTNSPGRRLFGPIQMSEQAVFQDAGVSIDQQNTANNFISYYTYGAGIAIALDLSLRTRGKSLDDFMRQMWLRHGKPEIAYTLADARRILGSVAGDTTWANDFWARYVDGHALPDYDALLEPAGLLVRKAEAGAPWIGLSFGGGAGNRGGVRGGEPAGGAAATGYTISTPVLVGTPAYAAGLESGDRILTVDGREVSAGRANDRRDRRARRTPRIRDHGGGKSCGPGGDFRGGRPHPFAGTARLPTGVDQQQGEALNGERRASRRSFRPRRA